MKSHNHAHVAMISFHQTLLINKIFIHQGDSGGPLVYTNAQGHRILVGVTSFGAGRLMGGCHSGRPAGIYCCHMFSSIYISTSDKHSLLILFQVSFALDISINGSLKFLALTSKIYTNNVEMPILLNSRMPPVKKRQQLSRHKKLSHKATNIFWLSQIL